VAERGGALLLEPARVVGTIETLRLRIEERFPGASLAGVVASLHGIATRSLERIAWIEKPHFGLRALIVLLLAAAVLPLVLWLPRHVDANATLGVGEFIQSFEASISATVFLGAAVLFLFTIERRRKRRRALAAIHELRALAHIVDMHQLTKDPDALRPARSDTRHSPKRTMTPFELGRYLDYCSETLALIAKMATLYAQGFHDEVALAAVDEVEGLTSRLSAKIWQKIAILQRSGETGRA
jgi:hypothetical protein